MICGKCGHFADDHTFSGSLDPRYCTADGCKCNGWEVKKDSCLPFTFNKSLELDLDAEVEKRMLRELNDIEDGGHWVMVWRDGSPYKMFVED